MSALGKFLQQQARHSRFWFRLFLIGLAVLLALNAFIRPEHPHFGVDAYPLFWPAFGLGGGLLLVLIVKKLVQPIIVKNEDYYHDQ